MPKRDLVNRLIEDFGKMLTIEGLRLSDRNNSCVLIFDGDIVLNIEYDPPAERLLFSAYLDELPERDAEPLLRKLLAANFFWLATKGATLCLEEGTNGIILLYSHNADQLDLNILETIVENFVQQAEDWKVRIAQSKQGADSGTDEAPGMEGFDGRSSIRV